MITTFRVMTLSGFVAFMSGLTAWVWLGDWRLGVTGLALLIVALGAAAILAGDR